MKIGICDSGLSYRPSNVIEVRNFTNRNKFDVDDNLRSKHGTHITNIISNLAPDVEIYVAKTMDIRKGSMNYLYPAIRWLVLECQVNVINCSFGSMYEDVELRNMIRLCDVLGVTIVCSAGNDGDRLIYPSAYDFSNIIRVGAIDEDGNITDWSSRNCDIYALGVDVNAQVGDDEWRKMSGTSQSSAIVAGTLARLDGNKEELFRRCVDGKLIFD
jgi:subtilisin family serine protease